MNASQWTLSLSPSSGPHTGDPSLCCLVRGEAEGPGVSPPGAVKGGRDARCRHYTWESEHIVHPDMVMTWGSACGTVPKSLGEKNGLW